MTGPALHQRAVIRQAIVTTLTGAFPVNTAIFARRATPLWKVPYPVILVYVRQEDSLNLNVGDPTLKRTMHVGIEARQVANENLDDVLDALAKIIEDAIKADLTIGGTCINSDLLLTEIDVADDGEKPFGAIRLTYEILYTA